MSLSDSQSVFRPSIMQFADVRLGFMLTMTFLSPKFNLSRKLKNWSIMTGESVEAMQWLNPHYEMQEDVFEEIIQRLQEILSDKLFHPEEQLSENSQN